MRLAFKPKAVQQLESLPRGTRERILRKLAFYAKQPEPLSFAKPLAGYGTYRFRIGNHRVIFDYENDTVIVLLVVGRENAYKNL